MRTRLLLTVAALALWVLPAPAHRATLLEDHFTEATTTVLPSHTMDTGAGWTDTGDCYADATDVAYCAASLGVENAYADAGAADGTLTAVFNIPAADDFNLWLIGRYTDASNWFQLNISRAAGGNIQILIYDVTASTYCAGPDPVSLPTGANPVTATFSGSTITFTADGTGVVENCSSSNNLTATKFGFGNYNVSPNVTGSFDDFLFDGEEGGGGGGTTPRLMLLGVGGGRAR